MSDLSIKTTTDAGDEISLPVNERLRLTLRKSSETFLIEAQKVSLIKSFDKTSIRRSSDAVSDSSATEIRSHSTTQSDLNCARRMPAFCLLSSPSASDGQSSAVSETR